MALIRCPKCNTLVKIPNDHGRATIRCSECEFKIPLDDDDAAPLKKSKKKKRGQTNEYTALWPLAFTLPLLTCPCLAGLHRVMGGVGMCFGITMVITAMVMAYLVAKREGLTTMDDMPWIVQRMPIVQLFFLFKWGFQRPMKVGPWLAVLIMAIVAMIVSIAVSESKNAFDARQAIEENKRVDGSKAGIDRLLTQLDGTDIFKSAQAAEKLAKIKPNDRQAEVARKLLDAANRDNLLSAMAPSRAWRSGPRPTRSLT